MGVLKTPWLHWIVVSYKVVSVEDVVCPALNLLVYNEVIQCCSVLVIETSFTPILPSKSVAPNLSHSLAI
jgi:hypothetical protein